MSAAAGKPNKTFLGIRPVNWVLFGVLGGLVLCAIAGIGIAPFGLTIVPVATQEGNDASRFEDRAAQIEGKLAHDSQNPELLLALSLAHLHAGNELREGMPSQEEAARAVRHYREASAAWSKYLTTTDSLDPEAVKQITPMFLILGESARDVPELKREVRQAARAYEILAKQSPSINTLMLLAYYRYSAFERRAARAAGAEALALAGAPAEKEKINRTLSEYAQSSDEREARVKEIAKLIGARKQAAQR